MSEKAETSASEPSYDEHRWQLLRDWATIWASEIAATAVDREAQETMQAFMGTWAPPAASHTSDHAPNPGTADAPGSAPAAAAPDSRDAEIAGLNKRIGQLERRLAKFERKAGAAGGVGRKPTSNTGKSAT